MSGKISFAILTLIGGVTLWLATIGLMAPIDISGPFNLSNYPYLLVIAILGIILIVLGEILGASNRVKAYFLCLLTIVLAVQNYISYRRFPPREGRVLPEYEDLIPPDPNHIVTSLIILTLVAILATIQTSRTSRWR